MADSKPQITATIKFRGVTIENMTVTELKELRDVINQLVGKEVERVVERHEYVYPRPVSPYPWGYYSAPTWTCTTSNTNTSDTIRMGEYIRNQPCDLGNIQVSDNVHYTLSCN